MAVYVTRRRTRDALGIEGRSWRAVRTCRLLDETASRIGGAPDLLQANNDLDVEGLLFALQIYGGELPFRDLFYLTDGIGYLHLPSPSSSGVDRGGPFFVQVT